MRETGKERIETGTASRSIVTSLFLFVLLCPFLSGQTSPNDAKKNDSLPQVTFSSRSELVLVPVIVTDRKGTHMTGLSKEDFSILENGSDRTVAVFDEAVANSEPVVAANRSDSVFTNDRGVTSEKRLVILALDAINTPASDQIRARKQMLSFLSHDVDAGALVSVVVLTPAGVKVVHDFTTDTSLLIRAVSKVSGGATFAEQTPQSTAADESALQEEVAQLVALSDSSDQSAVGAQKQFAIQWTYDALTQIAQAYSGVPGRKSLIWVTAGFPFSLADNNNQIFATRGNGDVSDNLDAYERMWKAITQANVAVYPVDARGLVNPAVMQASVGARSVGTGKTALPNLIVANSTAHDASLDTFRDFAEMTGGKAYFNTNDLKKSFSEASSDSSSYYLLGFYLPKDAKPGWHPLKVTVRRQGTQVRTRSGYLVASTKAGKNRPDEIRSALLSPFDSTALPLSVRWIGQSRAPNSTKTEAGFAVTLTAADLSVDQPDNNHLQFRIVAVARHSDGTVAETVERSFDTHLNNAGLANFEKLGMLYRGKFELPTGQYQVRFVIGDSLSGRVGSVTAPLVIK